MSYLIHRQLKLPLGKWAKEVLNARNQFAGKNNLPARSELFNWERIQLWLGKLKAASGYIKKKESKYNIIMITKALMPVIDNYDIASELSVTKLKNQLKEWGCYPLKRHPKVCINS